MAAEQLGAYGFPARPANYEALLALIKLALDITPEEVEIVTLRVPVRVLKQLAEINSNLERAFYASARHTILRSRAIAAAKYSPACLIKQRLLDRRRSFFRPIFPGRL